MTRCVYYIRMSVLLRVSDADRSCRDMGNSRKRQMIAHRSIADRPIDHPAHLSSFCHRKAPMTGVIRGALFCHWPNPSPLIRCSAEIGRGGALAGPGGGPDNRSPPARPRCRRHSLAGCRLIVVDCRRPIEYRFARPRCTNDTHYHRNNALHQVIASSDCRRRARILSRPSERRRHYLGCRSLILIVKQGRACFSCRG